jgi:hypothetical protein
MDDRLKQEVLVFARRFRQSHNILYNMVGG